MLPLTVAGVVWPLTTTLTLAMPLLGDGATAVPVRVSVEWLLVTSGATEMMTGAEVIWPVVLAAKVTA